MSKAMDHLRREMRLDVCSLNETVKYASDIYKVVNSLSADVKELRKKVQPLTWTRHELPAENEKLANKIEELKQC